MTGRPRRGPELDRSTPILVLRRSIGPFQHCALAVARSVGRLGVPVYSVRRRRTEPATSSRYITGVLDLPANGSVPAWIDALSGLGADLHGAILLPIDDAAAVAVGDHQDRLSEHFLLPPAPPGIQRRLASKRALWELCNELELPTPDSTFPGDESELLAQGEAHGYPVVVKRGDPWLAPRDPDAPSVAIVHDRRQLLEAYARMESDVAPQVMLQRYIPGDSDSVWMFNGYAGEGGECLCAFTGRKLRQSGPGTGPTTLGVCQANPEVAALAARLLRALDYRGIVDMGFRYDARDGTYRLLDVNPRLGSTFRLFASDDGIDVVRALHLDLTGRPVPPSRLSEGRKWLDERGDAVTSSRMARQGSLGPGSWARPLKGVVEGAWWAADDPWPFVAMSASLPPYALRKLIAGSRAGASARSSPPTDGAAPQDQVDRYFDDVSGYWNAVYDREATDGVIYRRRMATAAAWARELGLPPGARALDVGCGAGLMSVELARIGLAVTATDSSPAMVEVARGLMSRSGLDDQVSVRVADVHRLPFEDGAFSLIVALGVLPWLHDPATAVAELARVLARDGSIILTADNRDRLNRLVDPRENGLLAPLRPVKRTLWRPVADAEVSAPARRHTPGNVDRLLAEAGIAVTRRTTVGYGPFTVLGRPILPDAIGCSLDERLQRAAQDHARLRGGGWHYLVAGTRSRR
jgi:D-aspartate ligase